MKKFAVIDVGSNSVRLMFVADGKVLYKSLQTTRLGEGLALSEIPLLKTEAIERSACAFADFFNKAMADGAERVFAFATAAVRTAVNGQAFVEQVKELCGLTVEVVSGEEEAELGIIGALGNKDGAVIDIGGASTEIVVKKGGSIVYKKSVNIGVVRLKDKCGRDGAALKNAATEAAKSFGNVPTDLPIYGIGGTATTVAAQVLGLKTYASEQVTGAELALADLEKQAARFLEASVEEIAALPCMPQGRADVITGGAVLLATLLKELGWEKLIASDRDNLEGYAIKHGWLQ
ncbi:MAG: hypothetical protein IJX87_05810 [Clostridia bacterium]|nr:hypothetical protein [Clostridia bacterium]